MTHKQEVTVVVFIAATVLLIGWGMVLFIPNLTGPKLIKDYRIIEYDNIYRIQSYRLGRWSQELSDYSSQDEAEEGLQWLIKHIARKERLLAADWRVVKEYKEKNK